MTLMGFRQGRLVSRARCIRVLQNAFFQLMRTGSAFLMVRVQK